MGTPGEPVARPLPRLIGMVHLRPLPGAPRYQRSMAAVVDAAVSDALALRDAGFEALMVENFGDVPFLPGNVPPETVAAMAVTAGEVARAVPGLALGLNVLRNDARAALGLAAAVGARFVRVNVHVGAALTDQGLVEGRAWETLRARAALCPDVALLADLRVKHSRPLADPGPVEDEARDAISRGLADALVVSGGGTGRPPDEDRLAAVAAAGTGAPVYVGSGATEVSVPRLLERVHGVIVGTALKVDRSPWGPVDRAAAARFVDAARRSPYRPR